MRGINLILAILALMTVDAKATTESGDTIKNVSLDSVVVKSDVRYLKTTAGAMHLSMDALSNLPKIFGNADPLHYSQMLPGISTNGEYDAGIRVLGCENGHNYISINNTPIYGANHLLGIFSVFNASHFKQMSIQKTICKGGNANRLGAFIDMKTNELISDTIKGNLDIGLISSQGTLIIPTSKNSQLTVSGRGSYINMLYSSFLKDDDQETRYSFYDTNVNFTSRLNARNIITIDALLGGDNMLLAVDDNMAKINARWGNQMVSTHWLNSGDKVRIDNHAYFTRYYCDGQIDAGVLYAKAPSSISEFGYKLCAGMSRLSLGCDLAFYRIVPQNPEVVVSSRENASKQNVYKSREIAAYGDYTLNLSSELSMLLGVRTSLYGVSKNNYLRCSPSLNVMYDSHKLWTAMLGYSLRHQFIHQTGMTTLNSPLEYWVTSGEDGIPIQSSNGITADFHVNMPDASYSLTFETYYKWLKNQIEYNATIYSFLAMEFDNTNLYSIGSGRNYGINITITKNSGWLTGWIGYSWSKAFRTYNNDQLTGTFPSSHDRTHELNVVAAAHISKKITIGMTGVYATGTPFTSPKSYMILQNRLVPQYNKHNSNRLSPYFRVDLSLDYQIKKTKRFDQSINLSVYNITAHKNDLFYYMKIGGDSYKYKALQFAMRVMPSLSYSIKF